MRSIILQTNNLRVLVMLQNVDARRNDSLNSLEPEMGAMGRT
jgi:hypothetical protein